MLKLIHFLNTSFQYTNKHMNIKINRIKHG